MNNEIWKYIWNEFCEGHSHLDSLISKIPESYGPHAKSLVATQFGAFLRRPWSTARAFGINLAETPESFWTQNFIQLKKNKGVHEVLDKLTKTNERLPSEGTIDDFPEKLSSLWKADWGDESTRRLCALLSQDPLTIIRVHRNFLDRAKEAFPKSRAGKFSPNARVFKGYEPVLSTDIYREGGLQIQDEGSQVMALFSLFPEVFQAALSSEPQISRKDFSLASHELPQISKGATWVDACAGAGGKTLALADFMRGQGRIFAYDIYEKKIQALRRRVGLTQETNIQAFALNESSLASMLERFRQSVDGVLIDSPCSGQGVLRRNPDIKWNRKPMPKGNAHERSIEELQQKVLSDYSQLVAPGGRLVYGVCTFNKTETVQQVEKFLSNAPFSLEHSGFIGPYETDGFFMASLKRVPDSPQ